MATSKGNPCVPSVPPAELSQDVTEAPRAPTRRDRGVCALQTIYLGIACYVGLNDCAERLEAIAREDG